MLKCPVCGDRLIKSQPRFTDTILKLFYSVQPYQCYSENCWHGYLSKPTPASSINKSKQLPCTDELKAKLALKVVEGQSIYLLSRQYHLNPKQISEWHWHLVNNTNILFSQISAQPPLPNEKALILHLLRQVKQLKRALQVARKTSDANNTNTQPDHPKTTEPHGAQEDASIASDHTRSNWVHSASKDSPNKLSTESTP